MKTKYWMNSKYLLILVVMITTLNLEVYPQGGIRNEVALSGDVKYLVLFVETLEEAWDENELDYYVEEYYAANDWLVEEANFFGVDLSFDNSLKDNFEVVRVELDNNKRHGASVTLQAVLEKLNYRDLNGFRRYNQMGLNKEKEKLKVLLFWKNKSRSYAYQT
ncbi:MAG: hypothetical protein AAGF89_06990, partial [Bacteroidota bacterium]